MGVNEIKNICKSISIVRVVIIITVSSFLISPGILDAAHSTEDSGDVNKKIVAKFSKEIEIPAGSDYYVEFFSESLTLEGEKITPYSSGLSGKVKDAIAKSPHWIQRDLTRQFHTIDAEKYADLILNASKRYVDEIAFSIACSSLGNVPSADIIRDNVFCLYENDKWIRYADIVDYDDGTGDYYSTIRYWVIENGTERQLEYPKEIYYWYVVHPALTGEKAGYVYGEFWRAYLFNHNDLGYPLLKEKLSEINYLWDCESYSQHKHRTWKWSMENHPTAIEAVSYWIGKTVPEQAYGSRPGHPNIIAHEHNGWCGELQRIAVAAQRAVLIPSVGICDYGEDHVWREFYERGWHENDNWWADGGGAVDKPDVYAYGWGKNISALFARKGDSSIYEVTSGYIHPEDRKTVRFVVLDRRLQPVDGAWITAVVSGPKDITWLKGKIWDKIEELWNRLPRLMKGKILQTLYNKFKERYEKLPDITDGVILCIWNYTNMDGECTFELGKNRSYFFIVQHGNLGKPWWLAYNNALRILLEPEDTTYRIVFPFLSPRRQKHHSMEMPSGEIFFNISFSTTSYQLHESILGGDKGVYKRDGKIDFFIVDEKNFRRYRNRRKFNCYNYISGSEGNISISAGENNWYIVFKNSARHSNVILNFSVTVETSTTKDRAQIASPDTSIFDSPVFNVGETIAISGIATDDILLYIDDVPHEVTVQGYEWFYEWSTSELVPGEYLIVVECGDAQDEILIKLVDTIPPTIEIDTPMDKEIVEEEILKIEGHTYDNLDVERVEVVLDNGEWREATGTEHWYIYIGI